MRIPEFGAHGALPPFIAGRATDASARSPYQATMFDVVDRFCYSETRAKLLKGLNAYRKHLHAGGFTSGIQWIDGSFVENVEASKRRRAPNDIDVVTLFHRPVQYQINAAAWMNDFDIHIFQSYFDPKLMKPRFMCDTYPIDLDAGPRALVRNTTYWLGLFSDMRETNTKKGIIEIPLAVDAMEFAAIDQEIRGKFDV
jgi:hypothetical protein